MACISWNILIFSVLRHTVSLVGLLFLSSCMTVVSALGSMSFAAAAYGGNGPAFCGLRSSGAPASSGSSIVASAGGVECFGSDAASVYGAPLRLALSGLTAGDGFVCGLTVSSQLPYCWGNNVYVQQGTPTSKGPNITYSEICAGDNHLCALRSNIYSGAVGSRGSSGPPDAEADDQYVTAVDCWGYNMTGSFVQGASLTSMTAGSLFSCGLFAANKTPICWGDETGSRVISEAPKHLQFKSLAAGGYHVCGILLQGSGATLCWGRELSTRNGFPGTAHFTSLVGGRFHACGLLASQQTVSCWGLIDLPNSTPPPTASHFSAMVAGDYYTCAIPSSSVQPLCWGSQFPAILPTGALPPVDCMLCGNNCPASCLPNIRHSTSVQTPIIVGELATAVVVVACVLATAIFLVRYKLAKLAAATSNGSMSGSIKKQRGVPGTKKASFGSSFSKERVALAAELEEPKMSRAEVFSYQELEQATGGFEKEKEVGKGSFSIVYKGVLGDGRMVAVKRAAAMPSQQQKDSNEFRNELDLLSRLNHAHLLTLLGFCDDREERLLVYEFMVNGTLHEQLHGSDSHQLGWVRRVTIAVQAARGLEYLHGYACPPVIHRDIKSSNILLDDEWNARVSDFGLSLMGPMDSDSPLSELPAGTLGYLDPEYYRLHYLTTKSDVYSFGVLLLEIMSGRKAIDMEYDEGNIVEWAVPLIKEGQVQRVLDPRLEAPPNLDAVHKIARVAARCVKMRGKDRPSMDKVTTSLERALAMLMGTYSEAQPFLPSEVVLGSNRLHRKSSQKSSCRSTFDVDSSESAEDQHRDHRNPSSLTFPSINSSLRRGSLSDNELGGSVVDIAIPDHDAENREQRQQLLTRGAFLHPKSEIYPASPQQQLFLSSNF